MVPLALFLPDRTVIEAVAIRSGVAGSLWVNRLLNLNTKYAIAMQIQCIESGISHISCCQR